MTQEQLEKIGYLPIEEMKKYTTKQLREMYAELTGEGDSFPKSVKKDRVIGAYKSLVRAKSRGRAFKNLK